MRQEQVLGGRYELAEQVGSGGTAIVWRARDHVLGRTVAVKVLAGAHAGEPGSRHRIRQEARAAAALSHPNIAQVYDYGESVDDGGCTPYVVMEFVRGRTVRERLADGPMPARVAMRVAAEVAAALAAAHTDGLVHRDIKPANVMITPEGAKVVDFGIAAAIDDGHAGAPDGEILGTPAYLAPERLTDGTITPASDVYALGVLLYRMLTGESPWTADTTTQMLSAHIYVEPTPLRQLPDVPEYVTTLCNRCLTKDPTERPSARDAAAVLARGAGAAPPAASHAPPPAPVAPASPRRRRAPLIAAALTVPVAVAAGWWLLTPTEQPAAVLAASAPPGAASTVPAVPASAPGASGRPTRTIGAGPVVPTAGPVGAATDVPGTATGTGAPAVTATATAPDDPGPGDEPATTPTVAPTTEPAVQERTLSSAGGTVRATCTDATTARLLSWSAIKPYRTGAVDPGPGAAPTAVFRRGNSEIRMTVTCSGGTPSTSNG